MLSYFSKYPHPCIDGVNMFRRINNEHFKAVKTCNCMMAKRLLEFQHMSMLLIITIIRWQTVVYCIRRIIVIRVHLRNMRNYCVVGCAAEQWCLICGNLSKSLRFLYAIETIPVHLNKIVIALDTVVRIHVSRYICGCVVVFFIAALHGRAHFIWL